jgi:hypothetical protein
VDIGSPGEAQQRPAAGPAVGRMARTGHHAGPLLQTAQREAHPADRGAWQVLNNHNDGGTVQIINNSSPRPRCAKLKEPGFRGKNKKALQKLKRRYRSATTELPQNHGGGAAKRRRAEKFASTMGRRMRRGK